MSTITTQNPFTGLTIDSYNFEPISIAQRKVDDLKQAHISWSRTSLSERLKLVKTALQYFDKNREQIALDICEHIGRPLHHSRGEINGLFERGNYLCEIAESVLSPDTITGKENFERSIEHVPLGVIFVISAWNYPLLITINSVVPALISGNTVLLKHSSLTPKIGLHFQNAFKDLGSYKNLLLQTIVDHEVTGKIIEQTQIDHVIFTGSVSGGKSILKHTSQKFMMPALELGGKDAAYVHSDASLDHAVECVVDGAMYNSGQSCCGIERAYIHEKIYDEFLTKARALIEKYKLGDPKDPTTSLGPLAQKKAAKIMNEQIDDAKQKGAKVICGGSTVEIGAGLFFQPTLISVTANDLPIMQEENFGPILPVMKVKNIDEAIKYTNDSQYGLTAAIFTADLKLAQIFAEQANVGTVFMNRCDYLDPALPWTGVKNSGCGSTLSKYGFYNVTRRKSLHFKLPSKG